MSEDSELPTAARDFICPECTYRNILQADGPDEDIAGSQITRSCRNKDCSHTLGAGEQDYDLVRRQDVINWLKDHRKRYNKNYGQAAEEGTGIEKAFEAGCMSAIDKLLQELGESPESNPKLARNSREGGADQ